MIALDLLASEPEIKMVIAYAGLFYPFQSHIENAAEKHALLVHGSDDIISPPEHSLFMYLALKRAGIPAELHIYAGTVHDFGVRTNDRPYSTWTASCAHWLRDRGFLQPNAKE